MEKVPQIISILLACVFSLTAFSQKVKVKKGRILVDGVEVGIIEAVDKTNIIYAIKDLKGKELLTIDVDIAEGSTRPFEFNWMTVSSKDYSQVNVVDYSMLSMSLSHPKIISEILTKTYGIFSTDGVNTSKISEFFSQERFSNYKLESTGSGGPDMAGLNKGFEGKLKIRNNEVLLNGKAVAKLKVNDGVYAFAALKGKEKIEVIFYAAQIAGTDKTLKWLGVSDNAGRKTEVEMEYRSGNVKDDRAIAELLAEKYNVITANGIENLDVFFGEERKNLTEEYRVVFNEAKAAYEAEEALIPFRIEEQQLRDKDILSKVEIGNIYSKEGDKHLGTVEYLKGVNKSDSQFYIVIFDKSRQRIAKFTSHKERDKKEYELVGFDKKAFEVVMEGDIQFSKPHLYHSIAKVLTENGYGNAVEFGVERAKELAIEEYFAKSKEAGNLRYAPAYMITSKDERVDGLVTLYFENIPVPEGVEDIERNRAGNQVDGKKAGKVFRFQRVEGNSGVLYKANENWGFCTYTAGSEQCYQGVKTGATYAFVKTDKITKRE